MREIAIDEERVRVYEPGALPLYPCEAIKKKKRGEILELFGTFDIETTSYRDEAGDGHAFMYVWGFSIVPGEIAIGRTWEEYMQLMQRLHDFYKLADDRRMVCYVHNLAFEFQYICGFYPDWDIFARSPRDVVKAFCKATGIEYRCSYALTNMSLSKFLEKSEGVTLFKKSGKAFDYKKLRTAATPLSDKELIYLICDVLGLRQGIDAKLKEDSLFSIPLTSTGYVRRDCRQACFAESPVKYKRKYLWPTKPGPYLYNLQKSAARGGNTHTNPCFAGQVIKGVKSLDISSAYPAEITTCDRFPIGGYFKIRPDQLKNLKSRGKHTFLVRVALHGVQAKTLDCFLYIGAGRTLACRGEKIDNGRIISAEYIELACIEEIDLKIIRRQYKIDKIEYIDIYAARCGYLPREIRLKVLHYFYNKSTLKKKDPYLYSKSKNLLNAIFGCMLTDIVNPETVYDPEGAVMWHNEPLDIVKAIDEYYSKYSSYLVYAWGVMITARCRLKLQEMCDALQQSGADIIYCDTDSVKFVPGPDSAKVVDKINNKLLYRAMHAPDPAFVDFEGTRYTLGTWTDEGTYTYFCALGAKKYAYVKDSRLHTTISGVNTETGPRFFTHKVTGKRRRLKKAIKLFASAMYQDIVIPPEYSGRTTSVWDDDRTPHYINIDGCKILTAASVAIFDSTYTLGITDEYLDVIENPEAYASTN